MRLKRVDSKVLARLIHDLLVLARDKIRETLPQRMLVEEKFLSKSEALSAIHFPPDQQTLFEAQRRGRTGGQRDVEAMSPRPHAGRTG